MEKASHRDDPLFRAKLEASVPESLVVGRANAMFVSGWCFHREREIIDLNVRVAGETYRVRTHSMPRADVFAAHDRRSDPHGYRYRSGFWAIVPFESANSHRETPIELVAMLNGGDIATKRVGTVELKPSPETGSRIEPAATNGLAEPLIGVAMTTHNPKLDLFRAQVQSLRAQSHRNWVCVVSDDHSRPDLYAAVQNELEGDDRFTVFQTDERLGYYRNFERALELIPHEAELVALCDQDDRWHPDKLASLRDALKPGISLAYSDMNLVDEQLTVSSPTYWTERRKNHTNMTSLLVANTVTAASTMFSRELLEYALPFPAALGHAFHDHWLALTALATGDIAYIDRPLYDYVQHSGNAFGSRAASWAQRDAARSRGTGPRLPARSRLSRRLLRWRLDYFYNACSARLHAEILMMRCGDELAGRKRRAVKRMLKADRSLPLAAGLALRSTAARQRRSPTMGQEKLIARGILWRRFVALQGRIRRRHREDHGQALPTPPPPSGSTSPPGDAPKLVRLIDRKIAPLKLRVTSTCQPRVNMLVPTIDLDHFFGAYIGKFNLARRLAEQGLRVRIVAVDPTRLPENWHDQVRAYQGLGTLVDQVEVEFAPDRELLTLEVSPRDCFIATTSWTAHLAHHATRELERERFLFVIQEYDPLTYPVGTLGAITRQAYTFPHFAIFSTEFLRDYFRIHRLGVFARGVDEGERDSVSFRNAITSVDPPSAQEMLTQAQSLLFYARPEAHAERNMFELGLMAMAAAIRDGSLEGPWQFYGIGAMEPSSARITEEASIEILPRQSQDDYRSLLRGHSIGLSLMDTPHPSLVPLEMASAGMLVVTSTFENKTADSLRSISENLIPVEPTVEAVTAGLDEAVAASGDTERRLRGSRLDWSRSWQDSFNDSLVRKIKEYVEAA